MNVLDRGMFGVLDLQMNESAALQVRMGAALLTRRSVFFRHTANDAAARESDADASLYSSSNCFLVPSMTTSNSGSL
eukprot:1956008-Rhodomonas_salina.1